MELVIASNNKNKIREIKEIIGEYFDNLRSLDSLGVKIEVEETGSTFAENALLKAQAVSRLTGKAAIADDSGLCVGALSGAPGVYSARYAGTGDDKDNNRLLLRNMEGITDRKAAFLCAIVLYYPDGRYIVSEGRTDGEVLYCEKGEGGFGYDPLFFSYDLNESFGEAAAEDKNKVSHRARALASLREKLEKGLPQ